MDDKFSEYRPGRGDEVKQVNVRPRKADLEFLETIAEFEGDRNILPLIYEGIGRVIEDRLGNEGYMAGYETHLLQVMEHHRRRADELAALIDKQSQQG